MRPVLRVATAGSVDDGKSTLIGRLLHDSKTVLDDQLAAVTKISSDRGDAETDLALLTDGLRAEREQGITIDVAYRYVTTPRRKFIVADTPGHFQYTRNMVTGASNADVAMVLVDARNGIVDQSRRHAYVASLLGVRRLVLCVNKMDLVGWSQDRFEEIVATFADFTAKIDDADIHPIPLSALYGDNVVTRSSQSPWFTGDPLLKQLEDAPVRSITDGLGARMPIQLVIRPRNPTDPALHDYRAYVGQLAVGSLRVGDQVAVLPSGTRTRVAAIDTPQGPTQEASAPQSVSIRLTDDLDISRGDLLASVSDLPHQGQELQATVCWMNESEPLKAGGRYALKHTTSWTRAIVDQVISRVDIATLADVEAPRGLEVNEIGRVALRLATPLAYDEYRRSRTTGGFILVDETSNATVAAGLALSPYDD